MEGSPTAAEHEQGLLRFLEPRYRPRLRQFLGDERYRRKLQDEIGRDRVRLDSRFATQVDDIWEAQRRLLARGAPSHCYVVAYHDALDARQMPLKEALWEVDYAGGGFLSCIPGRLACFIDEVDRYVLERSGLTTRSHRAWGC